MLRKRSFFSKLLLLAVLSFPRLLFADNAPVTSLVLPTPYQVLCNAEPYLRGAVLTPYVELLSAYGQPHYQVFLKNYQATMDRLAGTAKRPFYGPKYPIVLAWVHPHTGQKVYLEAYMFQMGISIGLGNWDLTDQHNPAIPLKERVYRVQEFTGAGTLESALQDFLKNNPYPKGTWEVDIRVPEHPALTGRYASQNGSTLPADYMLSLQPALQFQSTSGTVTNCSRAITTPTPYAIKKLDDPKLTALTQLTLRVGAMLRRPLQRGARLDYLQPTKDQPLASAVVLVDPKTFSGYLVDPALAELFTSAFTTKDPKAKIDKLYTLLASKPTLVSFSSYKDITKLFYREVFSQESVLDQKEVLDLREQKGWEQWKKDTKKLLSDIEGLTVNDKGCIEGKHPNGDDFEVCGEKAKKSTQVTFFHKTKRGRAVTGHAKPGQKIHSHRGLLLDEQGHPVAHLPLASNSNWYKLKRTVTLVTYSLPRTSFQAVADVFSLSGLWDITVGVAKGLARRAIFNWFGVQVASDLWTLYNTARSTYQVYTVFSKCWDEVKASKDEYQLYDASDHIEPAVQALIAQNLKSEIIAEVNQALTQKEAHPTTKQPPRLTTTKTTAPATHEGPVTEQDQIDELTLSTPGPYLITDQNAQAAIHGPSTTYVLEQPEGKQASDMVFMDENNKPILVREIAAVEETGKGFEKAMTQHLLEGAREEGDTTPKEIILQVHDGQNVEAAIEHFQEKHTGKKWMEKFKGETVTVEDEQHRIFYQGPVVQQPLALTREQHDKLQYSFTHVQQLSRSYKNVTMDQFEAMLQREWYQLQTKYEGGKSLQAYTGAATPEAFAMRVQKGFAEVARLLEASAALNRANPSIAKIGPDENVSFADIDIGGQKRQVMSTSAEKVRIPKQIGGRDVIDPATWRSRILEPQIINGESTPRETDGEYRIFEDIAQKLGGIRGKRDESIVGKINLFSERAPCVSCTGSLGQFRTMFPNIEVQLAGGPYNPHKPRKK